MLRRRAIVHAVAQVLLMCCLVFVKVRKAAVEAVRVVLKASSFMTPSDDDVSSSPPPDHHPAASVTAKFCVQQIEKSGGMTPISTKSNLRRWQPCLAYLIETNVLIIR